MSLFEEHKSYGNTKAKVSFASTLFTNVNNLGGWSRITIGICICIMALFYTLVALCLSQSVLAYMAVPGPCPKMDVMKDFDVTKYLGEWFKYKVLVVPNHNFTVKCWSETYTRAENGTVISTATVISRRRGTQASMRKTWDTPNPAEPAKILVKSFDDKTPMNDWILASDYVSYSIVYDCLQVTGDHALMGWVMTRERKPPKSVADKIDEMLGKYYTFAKLGFRMLKQDECELKPDKKYGA